MCANMLWLPATLCSIRAPGHISMHYMVVEHGRGVLTVPMLILWIGNGRRHDEHFMSTHGQSTPVILRTCVRTGTMGLVFAS